MTINLITNPFVTCPRLIGRN